MPEPTPAPPRRIDYMPLGDLKPARRNPKTHDLAAVRASIDRFGYADAAVIDERTGLLLGGHGRTDVLTLMHGRGEDPPEGVLLDHGGDWLVPVQRGWASATDAEAEALLLALNRTNERGGWDDTALADMLDGLFTNAPDLAAAAGYNAADLDRLLADIAADTTEPAELLVDDPDDAPPAPAAKDTVSAVGDLWALGEHRLLVGDCTNIAAVDRLLPGERADCMWTDPPYGVDYVGKTTDALTITGDGAHSLSELLTGFFAVATAVLSPGAPAYIAHPPGPFSLTFGRHIDAAGWSLRQQLVWVKDVFVLGHSDYHYRHEPIWMAYTPGGEGRRGRGGPSWHGDNAQHSVFDVPRPKRSEDHPTMKPVELIRRMLANSCPTGGLVYDPFAGSGSTMIAAQLLGQRARLVELDPRYADVILRRYTEAIGGAPTRIT